MGKLYRLCSYAALLMLLLNACKSSQLTSIALKPQASMAFIKTGNDSIGSPLLVVKNVHHEADRHSESVLPAIKNLKSKVKNYTQGLALLPGHESFSHSPVMHRQDVKAIYHTYLDHVPLIKIILFSLVVLGIVILASVLVYQLSGSLNWTYFTAGILIMLAVVGSIIILS
jgi:hypothetical protein